VDVVAADVEVPVFPRVSMPVAVATAELPAASLSRCVYRYAPAANARAITMAPTPKRGINLFLPDDGPLVADGACGDSGSRSGIVCATGEDACGAGIPGAESTGVTGAAGEAGSGTDVEAPQPAQNLASGLFSRPHFPQNLEAAAAVIRFPPQMPQNFAFSPFSFPHLPQIMALLGCLNVLFLLFLPDEHSRYMTCGRFPGITRQNAHHYITDSKLTKDISRYRILRTCRP
jgi:hypothetical protein